MKLGKSLWGANFGTENSVFIHTFYYVATCHRLSDGWPMFLECPKGNQFGVLGLESAKTCENYH